MGRRTVQAVLWLLVAAVALVPVGAAAAEKPAPRLVLRNTAGTPFVLTTLWRTKVPVTLYLEYEGLSPDGPRASLGGHYGGVMVETAAGDYVDQSTFFKGVVDGGGRPFSVSESALPKRLKAGTYRLVFFGDAATELSLSTRGLGKTTVVGGWRTATNYKARWQPLGVNGTGYGAVHEDIPLTFGPHTRAHFALYSRNTGPGAEHTQLCLLRPEERGSCGTTHTPESETGGSSCCRWGAGLLWGIIRSSKNVNGSRLLEVNAFNVSVIDATGALTVVKD
jgi:hypothetical protein